MDRRKNYLHNITTQTGARGRIFKDRPNHVPIKTQDPALQHEVRHVAVTIQSIPATKVHVTKGVPSLAVHHRASITARRPQGVMGIKAKRRHRRSQTIWIAIHPRTFRPYVITLVMFGFVFVGASSYLARVKLDRIKNPPLNTGARTVLGAVSPSDPSVHTPTITLSTLPEQSTLSVQSHKYEAEEPKTIDIPSLKVHASVLPVERSKTSLMQAPPKNDIAGWFTESNRPGSNGLAVINGFGQAGIFQDLEKLKADSLLSITLGSGKKINYKIIKVDRLAADNDGAIAYIAAPGVREGLNLVAFITRNDQNSPRHYKEQMVVYTERQ